MAKVVLKHAMSVSIVLALGCPSYVQAQPAEGVIMRCGASKGTGYFFADPTWNPDGPSWDEDGISGGKIVLVRLGDEWDIQFDDSIGAYGYREDGAVVVPLAASDDKLTIGAFHSNYSDIYTFNLAGAEVVWSSHKVGTAIKKAAIYRAECEP